MPDLDVRGHAATARRWADARMDRLPPLAQRVVRRLLSREVLLPASSLAFYGMISALPLLLLSLSVAERVFGPNVVARLSTQATIMDARSVGQMITDVGSSAAGPGWLVILFALWPATAYGGGLRRAFVEARGDEEALPGLKGRVIGLLLVLVLPLVVVGGVPVSFMLAQFGGDGIPGILAGIALALAVGTLGATVLNTLLYQVFTRGDHPLRTTMGVASAVAFLSSAFSLGFVAYVRVATLEDRYGSGVLAMVMLFGVWLLVTNVLLLSGYHAILEQDGD
jgi:membrane protein